MTVLSRLLAERYEVRDCYECPFHVGHGRRLCTLAERPIDAALGQDFDPPTWCPLRRGEVLVCLKRS